MARVTGFVSVILGVWLVFESHAHAADSGFQGAWVSPPGPHREVMQLEERGSRVIGTYSFISREGVSYEGTLEAVREDGGLKGTWSEHPVNRPLETTQGPMALQLDPAGDRVEGWYGKADGTERTPWVMLRKTDRHQEAGASK